MRMRFTLLALLYCLISSTVPAQTGRSTVQVSGLAKPEQSLRIPLSGVEPFLAFSAEWQGEAQSLEVRFSENEERWGEWIQLGLYHHFDQSPAKRVSELHFAPAASQWVQLRAAAGTEALKLHFFNPGRTEAAAEEAEPSALEQRSSPYCPCPLGSFENRSEWCPSGTCPEDATPVNTSVTHLIVHHSAGTNQANDWAAVVRSIWDFHTAVNGWDDIGYNWLIDPNGVLYQGRGNDVLGAHFCGTNSGTMGICVLGDFTTITPTQNAKNRLTELLAWKSCAVDVDPLEVSFHASSGLELGHVSGHRDGCATSCPGDAFYPELPQIRNAVANLIENSCAPIAPPDELLAEAVNDTTILVQWEDRSDNELAFLLERSLSEAGAYVQIVELPANTTSYEDTGLSAETGYYYRLRARTAQDTSFYSNVAFAFTGTVDTKEQFYGQRIQIFPNPATEAVQLQWPSPLPERLQLRIINAAGQVVEERRIDGAQRQHQLNLGNYPAGLYSLQLRANGKQWSRRLLKN